MSMDSNLQTAFQAVGTAIKAKQPTLVSGTNIKTINGTSILGSGDFVVPHYANTVSTTLTYFGSGGSKGFNVNSLGGYVVGTRVRIVDQTNTAKWMEGTISYTDSTPFILVGIDSSTDVTGSSSSWKFQIAGLKGETGTTGSAGADGLGYSGTVATCSAKIQKGLVTFTGIASIGAFAIGQRIRVADSNDYSLFCEGEIVSNTTSTITVNVDTLPQVSYSAFRYYRVYITQNNGWANHALQEVQLYSASGVALMNAGTTVLSSSNLDGTRTASKTLDGGLTLLANSWSSSTTFPGFGWIKYDLVTAQKAARIELLPVYDISECQFAAPNTYKIQGSNDNTTWSDIYRISGDTGWDQGVWKRIDFDPSNNYSPVTRTTNWKFYASGLGSAGIGTSSVSGIATIDFGLWGANEAEVSVEGLTSIPSNAMVRVFFHGDDETATHTAKDHRYASLFMSVSAGTVKPAFGFTIYAVSAEKLTGYFKVRWEYYTTHLSP